MEKGKSWENGPQIVPSPFLRWCRILGQEIGLFIPKLSQFGDTAFPSAQIVGSG